MGGHLGDSLDQLEVGCGQREEHLCVRRGASSNRCSSQPDPRP